MKPLTPYIWLALACYLMIVSSYRLVNVALHKKVTQNGTLNWPESGDHPWNVSHSVDGRTNCTSDEMHGYLHYSGTAVICEPWWQLDLGYVYHIQAIHVVGRPRVEPRQLVSFRLFIGPEADNLSLAYRNNETTYNNGDIWINTTTIGRFLRIDMPLDNITERVSAGPLVLCEVEVYVPVNTIKVRGNTTMSSVYKSSEESFGPDRALDGQYPTYDVGDNVESCQCCSVTAGTEVPWWRIDFGKQLLIGGVNITGRPGQDSSHQAKGINVYISDTLPRGESQNGELVWNVPRNISGSFFAVIFEQPRLFQYMTIVRADVHLNMFLTICEVDIVQTECAPGMFGDSCSRLCHCTDGRPCDSVTGHCQTPGCADRWIGDACAVCPLGMFGDRCSRLCHCQDGSSCNIVTGHCQTPGCTDGWIGDACECQPGKYGHGCNETCGFCQDGTHSCLVTNGTCLHGCAAGYVGSDLLCKTECQPGRYGHNCNETCGECIGGNSTCMVTNGSCPRGCAPGYVTSDIKCKTECDPGYFGYNCNETCGHCYSGSVCSVTDGTCSGGCAPGYVPDGMCKIECPSGLYGQNCSESCGHCSGDLVTCKSIDGTCPHGCGPGFLGPTCKTECMPGTFGVNCRETCGHCTGGQSICSATDGTCPDDCSSGYMMSDPTCLTACDPGRFGPNCNETCGHCVDDKTVCQVTNGACPGGCAPGFNNVLDPTCKTECKAGRYGYNCNGNCGHCFETDTCSITNGKCPNGCAPGYVASDLTCNTECQPGFYGYNCNGTCGHCIGGSIKCSVIDGTCSRGCSPGYMASDHTCKTVCTAGLYGIDCTETCGHCVAGTTCLVTNGTCPRGCAVGYLASDYTCKTSLNFLRLTDVTVTTKQSSLYGNRDSTRAVDGDRGPDVEQCNCCSQTQNAELSWWQVDIGLALPIRQMVVYGLKDDSKYQQLSGFSVYLSISATFSNTAYITEPSSVTNDTYRIHVDGRYTRYIKIQRPGVLTVCEVEVFQSDTTCPANTYALACVPCGHCKGDIPCDSVTGRCPNGCNGSYIGELCTLPKTASTNVKYIVGAAVGIVVSILLLVAAVIALCKLYKNGKRVRCPFRIPTTTVYESAKPSIETELNLYDSLEPAETYRERSSSSRYYENTVIT